MKPIRVSIKLLALIIFLSVIKSFVCMAQSRGVDWVHGLGGNSTSLEEVATFYQNNRPILAPTRLSYPTGNGINTMAAQVQGNTGGTNRIGIGHSMGGTAVRQVSLWNNNHWSGVVTMGSPLKGAQIAASGVNGTNTAFLNNAINRLLSGPGVGAGVSPPILPGIGILIHAASIIGQTHSSDLASIANGLLMNQFGLTGQTASDLSPGSNYQNDVVGQGANIPKILIWGNESNPILWRLVGTYAGSDDDQGVSLASTGSDVYNYIAIGEEVLSWANLPMHGFHQWRKHKWQEGRNWIDTDSNTGWDTVIGAQWTETINGTYWENTCSDEHYYTYCDQQSDPELCRSYCIITYPVSYSLYHSTPSDGVVPSESAKNLGGAWQDLHLEALNINHGEFKRVDRIQPTLNWVLDGNYRNDIFGIH